MGKQVVDVKDSTDAQTRKTDNRNSSQRFHFQEKNNLYLSHQKSISEPYFTHHFIFHPTMRKQRLLLALCSLTLAVFFLDSCRKLVKNEAYYLAISKYVYAYTSGAIGRSDAIRVRFINPTVGSDQVGQKVAANLFSVSPSIPGDAVWEDDRTILLQPTEPLPYGKKYTGTVALGKLFNDVPKEAKIFEFEFNVRELSFEVVTFGLRT